MGGNRAILALPGVAPASSSPAATGRAAVTRPAAAPQGGKRKPFAGNVAGLAPVFLDARMFAAATKQRDRVTAGATSLPKSTIGGAY